MKHALLLLSLIATQAHAQIIYTNVIPDTTINTVGNTYHLDLDNDGSADFNLYRSEVPYYCCSILSPTPERRIMVTRLGTNVIAYDLLWGMQFPKCLPFGQVVGTGLNWSATNGMIRQAQPGGGGCMGVACVPGPAMTWALAWVQNPGPRYLGLRFMIAGATHYGWARISTPSATSFTLLDYAYNSVADEPIFAGETQCNIPYSLAVTNVDTNSVNLTWATFSSDTFSLRYRPTGTATWSEIDTITTTNVTVTGIAGCTEYEFQVAALCDGSLSGYTVSVTHTTDGCCTVPGSVAVGSVGVTSAHVSWGGVTAAFSYDARISADGGTTWTLIPGITTHSYDLTDLDSCTNYIVQVRTVCNGGTTDWSPSVTFKTFGCGACLDLAYCPSVGNDASQEWIAHVLVGTLNNVSGSNGGYGNFTELGTQLEIGQGHSITLAPGYSGPVWPEYFKVFVDFDHNGNFDGPGELAYNAGQLVGGPITGTLHIPASAMHGSTRMRVIMFYGDNSAVGCSNAYIAGETEDYCVDLVDNITGVEENPTPGQLHAYPNPSDREIFFDATGIGTGASLHIDVLDGIGRTAASKNMDQGRATINTSSLANGLYVYRITGSGVEVASGKFQVLH